MARIRTIKPEFFSDGKIIECSSNARLLFVGTWVFADDFGNLDRSAKQLKAQVFPADSLDCEPLIQELLALGLLVEYSSNGKEYLHIERFTYHQRIDRPGKPRCPIYDKSTNDRRVFDDHSRLKGREGKGNTLLGKPNGVEVLEHLNAVCGTRFQPVASTMSAINARIKEYGHAALLRVVDAKALEWQGTDMAKYLRPATLFNASKCASYVGQLDVQANAVKVDL